MVDGSGGYRRRSVLGEGTRVADFNNQHPESGGAP
jgi:hypothetical protein